MGLVAIVALAIWGAKQAPRIIHHQEQAEVEARNEREYRGKEQAWLARARARQVQLDQLRHDNGGREKATEQYLIARLKRELIELTHVRGMADYHAARKRKYQFATWFPWMTIAIDAPFPAHPLAPPAQPAGLAFELVMEGGQGVAFSPNGKTLAVGCWDQTVKFLDSLSGSVRATLKIPEGYQESGAYSPDGTMFAAVGYGKHIWFWDGATGARKRPVRWFDQPGQNVAFLGIGSVAFSSDGETVAAAAHGDVMARSRSPARTPWFAVALFDVGTGARRWEYARSGDSIESLEVSRDGLVLACGTACALLLDLRTGELKKELAPANGRLMSAAIAPDGRTVAGAGTTSRIPFGDGISDGAGRVTLWDTATGTILRTLRGPTGRALKVAFSPDGKWVAAGGAGPPQIGLDAISTTLPTKNASEIRLWDRATGRLVWSTLGELGEVHSLAFAPDGNALAFCDDEVVCVLDAHTGRLKRILMETKRSFRALESTGRGSAVWQPAAQGVPWWLRSDSQTAD
jgi:WD40 repeat protein